MLCTILSICLGAVRSKSDAYKFVCCIFSQHLILSTRSIRVFCQKQTHGCSDAKKCSSSISHLSYPMEQPPKSNGHHFFEFEAKLPLMRQVPFFSKQSSSYREIIHKLKTDLKKIQVYPDNNTKVISLIFRLAQKTTMKMLLLSTWRAITSSLPAVASGGRGHGQPHHSNAAFK